MARYRNRSIFAQSSGVSAGRRLLRLLMALVAMALIGGVAFLGLWEIAPPTRIVDKPVEVPPAQ